MDDLLDVLWPSEENVLSRVDEYYLYSHYLGYEPWPGKAYHSPVRPETDYDDAPSWAIHQLSNTGRYEFIWKDYATGQKGNVFDLIRILLKLETTAEAVKLVSDSLRNGLELPAPKEVARPQGFGEYSEIRVKSRPFLERELIWWLEIGVDRSQMAKYNITAISHWWLNNKIRYAGPMSFAYRMGRNYQVYFPHAPRERKFRHNFTHEQLPGYAQLPGTGDLLIITKSYKDLTAMDAWGFTTVAPRSENTPIEKSFLSELEGRFKRIVTLFDNDGKHRKDYPYEYLHVPIDSGQKDPTDYARAFGVPAAIEMVNKLLWK